MSIYTTGDGPEVPGNPVPLAGQGFGAGRAAHLGERSDNPDPQDVIEVVLERLVAAMRDVGNPDLLLALGEGIKKLVDDVRELRAHYAGARAQIASLEAEIGELEGGA